MEKGEIEKTLEKYKLLKIDSGPANFRFPGINLIFLNMSQNEYLSIETGFDDKIIRNFSL